MTSSDQRQSALTLLDAADVLGAVRAAKAPSRTEAMLAELGVRGVATLLLEMAREAERGERS